MTSNGESEIVRYGFWQSPITIESIFSQPATPAYPFQHNGDLYYLLSLAKEGGRVALMKWQDGHGICLTPAGFNIRSAVHEYGGKCFCLVDDSIVFNNYSDGTLYRQLLHQHSTPELLSEPDPDTLGYADLKLWQDSVSGNQWVIAVGERLVKGKQNCNQVWAIALNNAPSSPSRLLDGADFYASPVFSGNEMAWMQWQQPDMPWDRSALFSGQLQQKDGVLAVDGIQPVVDQSVHSVCQPGFMRDSTLLFACDEPQQDWWNLYQYSGGELRQLTSLDKEIGEPHWVFGQTRWLEVEWDGDSTRIVCIATDHTGDQLRLIELDQNGVTGSNVLLSAALINHLWYDPVESVEDLLVVVNPEDKGGGIIRLNLNTGESRSVGPESTPLMADGYSQPHSIECATSDGEHTFGYFYPPFNSDFSPPEDNLPPLIVMVHGGPTSRTSKSFNPLKQYFCSLGFAILDINHRGSTGYGRHYRQRLLGGWGEIDCMDIADAVRYLVEDRKIDHDAVFIRGGSAGGYAVLRALTRYPDLFAGGACYYGIGNLITLSEITHKFEGCYTDNLVGEKFDPVSARRPESDFVKRSPIFEMDRLRAPLILFQGLRDKVVPPEVTREVVRLLDRKGVRHDYVEYENEGHGFREMTTRIDSLQHEAKFFTDLL